MRKIIYFTALLFFLVPMSFAQTQNNRPLEVVDGVSWELASYRKENLSNIHYDIELEIEENPGIPIKAVSEISFDLKRTTQDLQIDFKDYHRTSQ